MNLRNGNHSVEVLPTRASRAREFLLIITPKHATSAFENFNHETKSEHLVNATLYNTVKKHRIEKSDYHSNHQHNYHRSHAGLFL